MCVCGVSYINTAKHSIEPAQKYRDIEPHVIHVEIPTDSSILRLELTEHLRSETSIFKRDEGREETVLPVVEG